MNTQQPSDNNNVVVKEKLPKARVLFKESFAVYKKNFKFILLLMGIPFLVTTVIPLIIYYLHYSDTLSYKEGFLENVSFLNEALTVSIIIAVVSILIAIVGSLFASFANFGLIGVAKGLTDGEKKTVWQTYKEGMRLFFPFIFIAILTSLVVIGGTVLFIIPGILLSFFVIFANYARAVDGHTGMDSLLHSWNVIRGHTYRVVETMAFFGISAFILWGIVFGAIIFAEYKLLDLDLGATFLEVVETYVTIADDTGAHRDQITVPFLVLKLTIDLLLGIFNVLFFAPLSVLFLYVQYKWVSNRYVANEELSQGRNKKLNIALILGVLVAIAVILSGILAFASMAEKQKQFEEKYNLGVPQLGFESYEEYTDMRPGSVRDDDEEFVKGILEKFQGDKVLASNSMSAFALTQNEGVYENVIISLNDAWLIDHESHIVYWSYAQATRQFKDSSEESLRWYEKAVELHNPKYDSENTNKDILSCELASVYYLIDGLESERANEILSTLNPEENFGCLANLIYVYDLFGDQENVEKYVELAATLYPEEVRALRQPSENQEKNDAPDLSVENEEVSGTTYPVARDGVQAVDSEYSSSKWQYSIIVPVGYDLTVYDQDEIRIDMPGIKGMVPYFSILATEVTGADYNAYVADPVTYLLDLVYLTNSDAENVETFTYDFDGVPVYFAEYTTPASEISSLPESFNRSTILPYEGGFLEILEYVPITHDRESLTNVFDSLLVK